MIYGVCVSEEKTPRAITHEDDGLGEQRSSVPTIRQVTVSLWAIEEGARFSYVPLAIYTEEGRAYDRARAEYATAQARVVAGEVGEVSYKTTLTRADELRDESGGEAASPRLLLID